MFLHFRVSSIGDVTGDVGMGDFGGGSTDGLVSTAGELWWFKMGSNRLVADFVF